MNRTLLKSACLLSLTKQVVTNKKSNINPITDSKNLLNTFIGKSKMGRKSLILEASGRTAYREGDWIIIPAYNVKLINNSNGSSAEFQLYNLKNDLAQQINQAKINPSKLSRMLINFTELCRKNYDNQKNKAEYNR